MPGVRQAIVESLNARGALSLDDIARAVNLSNLATRYHLGLLIRAGLVLALPGVCAGQVGRPRMRYVLTERARDELPKQYDRLAIAVLDQALQMWGRDASIQLLRRAGESLAADCAAAAKLRREPSMNARIRRTAGFLSARGYAASVDGSQLVVHNCPYAAVEREHPEICELDLGLVSALLCVQVEKVSGGECRFVLGNKS